MKLWEESEDEVREIRPNKEIAKSIMKMIKIRLKEDKILKNKIEK